MAVARYDDVAQFYVDGWPDDYQDSATCSLLEHAGNLMGKRVLDVACGHGRISRELARRGAQVVGVDISRALLGTASEREQHRPLGIDYFLADISAEATASWATTKFDLAVCSFGLSDIDDLDGALTAISRVLRADGRFVFSILHPCFPGDGSVSGSWPTGTAYATEGWWVADAVESTLRAKVGAHHRTLTSYIRALHQVGLMLESIEEPAPPADWTETHPDATRYPVFFVASCRRVPPTTE
jgi:2-polyprenyl-3-methyl-5-hydroxy-6-metoxy-1,4-benzoquinol methylase